MEIKAKYIGLCIAKIQEYTLSDFFHAVVKRACERGYKVLVFNTFSDLYMMDNYDKGEIKVFNLIPYDILDGLIILSESIKNAPTRDGIIAEAKKHNVPIVSVEKEIPGCYSIVYDYRSAFEEIVRHVVAGHGCKTVNVVAGFKNNPFSDERIDCCRRVLGEYNITLEDERILYGDFWADPTARAFDEFMATGLPLPDAFICCNDSMAIEICSKLKDIGKSVPGDVIVTGFDGIFAERYHIPRLTTAKQDTELAGEVSVDVIADIPPEERAKGLDGRRVIEHKVVYSHSCGCKKIDYREATGQITPLFQMADNDSGFDTHMYDFSAAAAEAKTTEELGEVVLRFTTAFGYHYFGLSLNEDFMNMSDSYDDIIDRADNSGEEHTKQRLILCECCENTHYPPVYSDNFVMMRECIEKFNTFLFWTVHFRDKYIGFGAMALSTGCDGFTPNDDLRHIVKYTRHLSQVLQIADSQSGLEKVISRLEDLYIRDHVTGLYNRRGFYNDITKRIAKTKNTGEYLIIISIDMDGLKFINDSYGHAEGDVAIKAISAALISIWGANEVCARFGGDEFTVASFTSSDPDGKGKDIVKRIKESLAQFNSCSGKPYLVGSSFGIHYEQVTDGTVPDNLIKAADDLMYKEKASHKESRYRKSTRE
ncbi:MAG: GGDEF domain-containing protein [Ruminococcus sp.]|nr:GGDEF domain-containing protein [Ruminococcus sp.]